VAMALALSAGLTALPALAQHGPHGRFGGHEGGLAHAIIGLKAELNLSVGRLEFRSTSFDWLVAAETSAQLQGRGTINGGGDYAFAVMAIDGQSAAGRIRIWNRATGTIVYDSRPGATFDESGVTPLGGGSIQLHAR